MVELIESVLKLLPLILALAGAFAFIYRVDHKAVTNREKILEMKDNYEDKLSKLDADLRCRIRDVETKTTALGSKLETLESEMIKDLIEIKVSLAEIKGALRIKNNA